MKRIFQLLIIFSLTVLLTGVVVAPKTSAEGGSCYLKALRTDVFVKIYDLKRNGDMGSLLWVGRINKGQKVLVSTPNARFRYYYNSQPDVKQPMSGNTSRWCNNNNTIVVP